MCFNNNCVRGPQLDKRMEFFFNLRGDSNRIKHERAKKKHFFFSVWPVQNSWRGKKLNNFFFIFNAKCELFLTDYTNSSNFAFYSS